MFRWSVMWTKMILGKDNMTKTPSVSYNNVVLASSNDEGISIEDVNSKVPDLYDDVNSFKKVVFQSDPEEDFTEGKRLTSLVRESYLNHVRQLLFQNYQQWYDKCTNGIGVENEKLCLSSVDIENCVNFLEQKALRSCMIASLYRESMISLISSIKQKTKERSLFDNLNKFKDFNVFKSNKCLQTDSLVEKHDVECQTGDVNTNSKRNRTTSLLDLPLPDPKDVLQALGSDFIDGNRVHAKTNSAVNHLNETVARVAPQPVKPICRVVAKRPSFSEELDSGLKRKRLSSDSDPLLSSNMSLLEQNKSKEVIDNFDLISMLTDNNKINRTCSNSKKDLVDIVSDLIDVGSKKDKDLSVNSQCNKNIETVTLIHNSKIDGNALSLDERLAEMDLLLNEEDSNSSSTNFKVPAKQTKDRFRNHRGSWYIEMTAHSCNLAKILLSLSDSKKQKIKEKFNEMFGSDDEDDSTKLTEDNLLVCRKRTANVVVAELTPYFVNKRIASRYLFKEFAKCVTDSILKRTYASDSRAITQFITEYFCEHNSVESMKDIDFT